jgi:hypothetical protein
MELPELLDSTVARHELEDGWRLALREKLERYMAASEEYRRLMQDHPYVCPPDPESALARAYLVESEALAEFTRVLRIFTDLIIHHPQPMQSFDGHSDGE